MPQTFKQILQAAGLTHRNLIECATEDNMLAFGTNTHVYNIPQLPDYVLLVHVSYDIATMTEDDLQDVDDILPGVNVGQPVAGIEKSFLVLRKQHGVKLGVPYTMIEDGWNEQAQRHYVDCLRRTASMPQSAYDNFAQTLRQLEEAGCWFDFIGDNLFIDEQAGSFNLLDVRKAAPVIGNRLGLPAMVLALVNFMLCAYQVEHKQELASEFGTIWQKCRAACQTAGLPTDIDEELGRYVADTGIGIFV